MPSEVDAPLEIGPDRGDVGDVGGAVAVGVDADRHSRARFAFAGEVGVRLLTNSELVSLSVPSGASAAALAAAPAAPPPPAASPTTASPPSRT